MGVPGLWQLLEPSKHTIDWEQFRGKRMAIDMNIWMHQALKSRGASASSNPNFYLSILFRRICKLLFYGIKPVFVFDGAVPELKKATMDSRRKSRRELQLQSDRVRQRLVKRIFKRLAETAVEGTSKKMCEDLTSKFLRHISNTEESRRALQDVEMFAPRTNNQMVFISETSKKAVELEMEQQADDELARDFMDSFPVYEEIDFESKAYQSLPLSTQLRIVLILKNKITYGQHTTNEFFESNQTEHMQLQSVAEKFSKRQVNRLLFRRELARRHLDLQSRINTIATLNEVKAHISSDQNSSGSHLAAIMEEEGCQIQVLRIASQDEGHAILIKRSSSSEAIAQRLQSLIKSAPLKQKVEHEYYAKSGATLSEDEEPLKQREKLKERWSLGDLESRKLDCPSPTPTEDKLVEKAYVIQLQDTLQTPALEGLSSSQSKARESATRTEQVDDADIFQPDALNAPEEVNYKSETNRVLEKPSHQVNNSQPTDFNESDGFEEVFPINPSVIPHHRGFEDGGHGITNSQHIQNDSDESDGFEEVVPINPAVIAHHGGFEDGGRGITNSQHIQSDSDESDDFEEVVPINPAVIPHHGEFEDGGHEITNLQHIQSDSDESDGFEEVVPIIPAVVSDHSGIEDDDDDDIVKVSDHLPAANFKVEEDVESGEEEEEFEIDDEVLLAEAERLERQTQQTSADSLSEAEHLLHLFGLPVLTSPEEAEAQCSRLQQLGLVDVVASDDSDVWLFGAEFVCRHLFGGRRSKKNVEKDDGQAYAYSIHDIQERLGLDRAQFLRIALLCGSDYTRGVPNVGPVTALEILAHFAAAATAAITTSSIKQDTTQPASSVLFDVLSVRREIQSVLQPLLAFRSALCEDKLKNCLPPKKSSPFSRWQSLDIPPEFPNEAVVQGYLLPKVDSSISNFRWNPPDVPGLTHFAIEKLGWSKETSKATLQSVIKSFQKSLNSPVIRTTHITDHFQRSPVNQAVPKRISRLAKATLRLKYGAEIDDVPDLDDDDWTDSVETSEPTTAAPMKKRCRSLVKTQDSEAHVPSGSKKPRIKLGSKTKLQPKNMSG